MKVLTLHQPWASLIAFGVKTIETRSWQPPPKQLAPGERFAIHAAKLDTDRWMHDHPEPWRALGDHIGGNAPVRGAIVATARLRACLPMLDADDCVPTAWMPHVAPYADRGWHIWHGEDDHASTPRWRVESLADQVPYGGFAPGRWAWLLTDVEPLAEPVPFKGGQGLSKSWEPAA